MDSLVRHRLSPDPPQTWQSAARNPGTKCTTKAVTSGDEYPVEKVITNLKCFLGLQVVELEL